MPGLEVVDVANCLAESGTGGVIIEGDESRSEGLQHQTKNIFCVLCVARYYFFILYDFRGFGLRFISTE